MAKRPFVSDATDYPLQQRYPPHAALASAPAHWQHAAVHAAPLGNSGLVHAPFTPWCVGRALSITPCVIELFTLVRVRLDGAPVPYGSPQHDVPNDSGFAMAPVSAPFPSMTSFARHHPAHTASHLQMPMHGVPEFRLTGARVDARLPERDGARPLPHLQSVPGPVAPGWDARVSFMEQYDTALYAYPPVSGMRAETRHLLTSTGSMWAAGVGGAAVPYPPFINAQPPSFPFPRPVYGAIPSAVPVTAPRVTTDVISESSDSQQAVQIEAAPESRPRRKAARTETVALSDSSFSEDDELLGLPGVVVDRTPAGDKRFHCPHPGCAASMFNVRTLSAHLKADHGMSRPFLCPMEDCGKPFASRAILAMHMNVHTGNKPYKCTYEGCDAAFGQQSNLKRHYLVHTGERPVRVFRLAS